MRILAIIFCSIFFAYANTPSRVINLYNQQDYKSACLEGSRILRDYKDDETFVNAYAIACLRSDFIDLAIPAAMYLRKDTASRQNASYILTVALQKKLLYYALIDNIDIKDSPLPDTPHILSKVYNSYVAGNYKERTKGVYELEIDGLIVTLDTLFEGGNYKVRIQKFDHGKIIEEHLYW